MQSITSSKSQDKAQTLSFGLKKEIRVFINSTKSDDEIGVIGSNIEYG